MPPAVANAPVIPQEFFDSITQEEFMVNPVKINCGHIFSPGPLAYALRANYHRACPLCRARVTTTAPDADLAGRIQTFVHSTPGMQVKYDEIEADHERNYSDRSGLPEHPLRERPAPVQLRPERRDVPLFPRPVAREVPLLPRQEEQPAFLPDLQRDMDDLMRILYPAEAPPARRNPLPLIERPLPPIQEEPEQRAWHQRLPNLMRDFFVSVGRLFAQIPQRLRRDQVEQQRPVQRAAQPRVPAPPITDREHLENVRRHLDENHTRNAEREAATIRWPYTRDIARREIFENYLALDNIDDALRMALLMSSDHAIQEYVEICLNRSLENNDYEAAKRIVLCMPSTLERDTAYMKIVNSCIENNQFDEAELIARLFSNTFDKNNALKKIAEKRIENTEYREARVVIRSLPSYMHFNLNIKIAGSIAKTIGSFLFKVLGMAAILTVGYKIILGVFGVIAWPVRFILNRLKA